VAGSVNEVTPEWLELIATSARKQGLEGYVTRSTTQEHGFKVFLCGMRDRADLFLDELHIIGIPYGLCDVEISPFIQDKDYRGAFRVVI